jgi:hypothetical protein
MPYAPLDVTKPISMQTRQVAIDVERTNLIALRNVLAANGCVQGWNYTWTGGTIDQPGQMQYRRGTEWIAVNVFWGTVGGEFGNAIKAVYFYDNASGAVYDPMADINGNYVANFSYDADGNCIGITWGKNWP